MSNLALNNIIYLNSEAINYHEAHKPEVIDQSFINELKHYKGAFEDSILVLEGLSKRINKPFNIDRSSYHYIRLEQRLKISTYSSNPKSIDNLFCDIPVALMHLEQHKDDIKTIEFESDCLHWIDQTYKLTYNTIKYILDMNRYSVVLNCIDELIAHDDFINLIKPHRLNITVKLRYSKSRSPNRVDKAVAKLKLYKIKCKIVNKKDRGLYE